MDTAKLAGKMSKLFSKGVQDEIIDTVADYDIEFAAKLDDLADHKLKETEIEDLNRLKISIEPDTFNLNDTYVVFLDNKPIAEYYLKNYIEQSKFKLIFNKL